MNKHENSIPQDNDNSEKVILRNTTEYGIILEKLPFSLFLCEYLGGVICTPLNSRAEMFSNSLNDLRGLNTFFQEQTELDILFSPKENVNFFQKHIVFQEESYLVTMVRINEEKALVMLENMTPLFIKLDTLSRSQLKYKSALMSMGEGVIVVHKGKIREMNRTVSEIFGVDNSEMINQPVGSLIGFNQWNILKKKLSENSLVREYIVFQLQDKRHIELIASEIDGKTNDYLLLLKDLTREKEQLEEINRLSRFKENVLDSIPSALVVIDENNIIIEANRNFYKNLEIWEKEHNFQADLLQIFPQFKVYMPIIQEVRTERHVISGVENDVEINKKKKRFNFTFLPMGKTKQPYVLIVFNDISKEYQLQESLIQAQKMEIIGQLAGGFVHDFNNVIGSISGVGSLMKMDLNSGKLRVDKLAHRLEIIDLAIARAKELVSKLLVLGRKVESEKKLIDVRDEVHESIAIIKPVLHKQIEIVFEAPPFPVIAYADKTFLQQVFINLLQNANDAMADKGNLIKITISILHDLPQNVELDEEKEWIEIIFKDNGSGIPKEILNKIFTPFFTTKPKGKGTGLGLAMVYNLIREHGGKISVDSKLGQGTSFKLYLPRHNKAVDLNVNYQEEIIKGSGVVAIVDDDEVIRLVGKNMLQKCGYEVITFTNGRKFIDYLESSEEPLINLVLLDLIMPEMNGFETFNYLKKHNYLFPIIILTGFKADELAQKMRADGAVALVQKPFSINEISILASKYIKNEM